MVGPEREATVTDTPAGLTLVGSVDGAVVTFRPLQRVSFVGFVADTASLTGTLLLIVSLACIPLRLLDLVPIDLPPLALLSCPVAALVAQMVAATRRDASVMTLRVTPQHLVVEHRLLGVSVVTERYALDDVRRFELDHRDRLVIGLRTAPPRYEPIPGLSEEARTFLVELLEDARQSGSRFARDEHASARDAAAVAQLAELSRSR